MRIHSRINTLKLFSYTATKPSSMNMHNTIMLKHVHDFVGKEQFIQFCWNDMKIFTEMTSNNKIY